MRGFDRSLRAVAVVLAIVAGDGSAARSAPTEGRYFVIGGKPSDPFWSAVKRGAEDAGVVVKAHGGSVTWLGPQTYDNLGPDAAQLVRTALSQHPAGIVAPDWVPDAEDPALEAATAAGVRMIIYNSGGMDAAKRVGALNYIGTEEYTAGVASGKYFAKHDVKTIVCVNTLPGTVNIESRCKGVADGAAKEGGTSTELPLPSTSFGNPTAVTQAIKAALLRDAKINGVITINTLDANSASQAISQAGDNGRVRLGNFNLDLTTLQAIKDGTQMFAVDQQPYLQGFLAVSMLDAYVAFGLALPEHPLLTGPLIIDASNVDAALAGAKAGVR